MRRAAIAAGITVPVCIAVVLAIVLAVVLRSAHQQQQRIDAQLAALKTEKRLTDQKVERLTADLTALTNERLPFPLLPLAFDEVFHLDKGGIVSVLFTQIGTPDIPVYEYRIVMRNKSETRTFPDVRILLFNDAGVQVGSADIRDSSAWKRPGNPGLSPGEVMTISGRVVMSFDSAPSYFVVVHSNEDGSVPKVESLPKLPF